MGIFLRIMSAYARGARVWLLPRMLAAGLLVGLVAWHEPAVVGNGQEAIAALIAGEFEWVHMVSLLGLKILLVAIVFGVGTMGGVLTPTLMIGCFLGGLFGLGVKALGLGGDVLVFAFVGMACFFAVAGRAPVTALLLAIEFTMDASLLFPLMVGVAAAYAFGRLIAGPSLYDSTLARESKTAFGSPLSQMCVSDIFRPATFRVYAKTPLERVLRIMLRHPGQNVPVSDEEGHFIGLIPYNNPLLLEGSVTSVMDTKVPVLTPDMSLPAALENFANCHLDTLPVVVDKHCLLGLVSRVELYQTLALMMRKELARKH